MPGRCNCCSLRVCALVVALVAVAVPWCLVKSIGKWKEAMMAEGNSCLGEQMVATMPVDEFQPLSWDKSYAKAKDVLGQMEPYEKYSLMQGRGWVLNDPKKWWYTGNIPPIQRLGIPSQNQQDAAGGIRTMWSELVGTVTCWPSALAMAATWDPHLVRDFATAMASEFAAKGANLILGPSVQVHRVARNGRNFEYLSGEDPYLGSRLAAAYVAGVSSKGLLTSVKHWGFNEQETNRDSESSVVDEKTAWELYYPPFEAAIDAGVTTVMCGYNRVDGEFACSSKQMLTSVLREKMGFRGFVQSDWWATHGTTVAAGLDQEMPGNHLAFDNLHNVAGIFTRNCSIYFAPETLSQIPQDLVDTSVTRILAAMFRMGQVGKITCLPPCCENIFKRNATSDAHAELAHEAASASVVLLKNSESTLPISSHSVKSIAVVGSAAVAEAYDPAGSSQALTDGLTGSWNTGDYYSGGGSGHVTGAVVTPWAGIHRRALAAGIRVINCTTDDIALASKVAAEVDVTIIVAATTSGEAVDRKDLNLDHGADELVDAISRVAKKSVVLVQAPGAVLMPWRDAVSAIALMFLGGQETGHAWASVLFGDHAPTGRLPIMIPATANDTTEPSTMPVVNYSEGMKTSYRNPRFKAAYPFGHGLTFAAFEYGSLQVCTPSKDADLCLELRVSNTGGMPACTIVQLYAEFPAEAGHPAPILKGFQKTALTNPGSSVTVALQLTGRDLSYYDANAASWTKVSDFVAHVGESSGDIRTIANLHHDVKANRWIALPSGSSL